MSTSAIPSIVKKGGDNFVRNVTGMWDGMRPRDYIRIVVIVGAYLLLRPYLLKLAAKLQAKEYAKQNNKSEKNNQSLERITAKISPNELRDGGKKMIEKSKHGASEGVKVTGSTELGEKVKRRQKNHETNVIEQQNQKQQDLKAAHIDDDKKDINILEYLVDYEEGKEGW